MPHVTRSAPILSSKIVRVNRKLALAISIVVCLAEDVIALHRDFWIQATVESNDHLRPANLAARFILIDVTQSRNWANASRRCRRDGPRQRRIDISRANRVRNSVCVESDEPRYVLRQLALNLNAAQSENRRLEI